MKATVNITIEAMVNRSALKLRGRRSSSEYFITVKFDPQIRLIRSKSKSVEPRPGVEAVPGLAGRSILRSEASDIRLTEVQAPEFGLSKVTRAVRHVKPLSGFCFEGENL
jgi:hypothetical protein